MHTLARLSDFETILVLRSYSLMNLVVHCVCNMMGILQYVVLLGGTEVQVHNRKYRGVCI